MENFNFQHYLNEFLKILYTFLDVEKLKSFFFFKFYRADRFWHLWHLIHRARLIKRRILRNQGEPELETFELSRPPGKKNRKGTIPQRPAINTRLMWQALNDGYSCGAEQWQLWPKWSGEGLQFLLNDYYSKKLSCWASVSVQRCY